MEDAEAEQMIKVDGPNLSGPISKSDRVGGYIRASKRYMKVMKVSGQRTIWRVIVPTVTTGVITMLVCPWFFRFARWAAMQGVPLTAAFDSFVGNFLTIFGLLFSILGGSSYASLYGQNEAIYYAVYAEVSEAKALVEQVAMVCQGRPINDKVLAYIEMYVRDDLQRLTTPPSVMLATRPSDDPLESILYLTSVGVPSVIYETVRSLRQLRGQRLGAIQRKLPPIQLFLLWVLGTSLLMASPLLVVGMDGAGSSPLIRLLFGCLCGSIVMTMRIIHELWNPTGGVYNVDGVLRVAVSGLQEEIRQRRQGVTFSTTDMPSAPPKWRPDP